MTKKQTFFKSFFFKRPFDHHLYSEIKLNAARNIQMSRDPKIKLISVFLCVNTANILQMLENMAVAASWLHLGSSRTEN